MEEIIQTSDSITAQFSINLFMSIQLRLVLCSIDFCFFMLEYVLWFILPNSQEILELFSTFFFSSSRTELNILNSVLQQMFAFKPFHSSRLLLTLFLIGWKIIQIWNYKASDFNKFQRSITFCGFSLFGVNHFENSKKTDRKC